MWQPHVTSDSFVCGFPVMDSNGTEMAAPQWQDVDLMPRGHLVLRYGDDLPYLPMTRKRKGIKLKKGIVFHEQLKHAKSSLSLKHPKDTKNPPALIFFKDLSVSSSAFLMIDITSSSWVQAGSHPGTREQKFFFFPSHAKCIMFMYMQNLDIDQGTCSENITFDLYAALLYCINCPFSFVPAKLQRGSSRCRTPWWLNIRLHWLVCRYVVKIAVQFLIHFRTSSAAQAATTPTWERFGVQGTHRVQRGWHSHILSHCDTVGGCHGAIGKGWMPTTGIRPLSVKLQIKTRTTSSAKTKGSDPEESPIQQLAKSILGLGAPDMQCNVMQ